MRQQKAIRIVFNDTAIKAKKRQSLLLSSIKHIIQSGVFLEGENNRLLANDLSVLFENRYVTTVGSGHDALFIALSILSLQPDDEVIFPVNSYPTAFPVCLSGATPVACDVNENGQLDPLSLAQKLTKKTKAVVLVHLYGLIGNVFAIKKLLAKRKIVLIEDCAQALGAEYKGKPVGALGDIACFSFYPTKNLGALGDGGAIVTNNKRWHLFFQKAKMYGERKRYKSEFVAGHSRLPELQAGMLRVYLKTMRKEIEKRSAIAAFYKSEIVKAGLQTYIRVLVSDAFSKPAPHLFVVKAERRNALMRYLQKRGIPTLIHYPLPVHKVPAFAKFLFAKETFPNAQLLSQTVLSLPFHPYMQKASVVYIINVIRTFYASPILLR